MVNILNIQHTINSLNTLKENAIPVFGKMTPQHMVEHLAKILKVSSGQTPVQLYVSVEESEVLKQKIIYSDFQFAPGIKSPLLGDEPPALLFKDLNEALSILNHELNYFENYFKNNPLAMHTHPRLGELKFEEWTIFHNKHFAHHFKQYNLQ